jgi:hypothetical protein
VDAKRPWRVPLTAACETVSQPGSLKPEKQSSLGSAESTERIRRRVNRIRSLRELRLSGLWLFGQRAGVEIEQSLSGGYVFGAALMAEFREELVLLQ